MFNIRKQIKGLYLSSIAGNLSLTGAWVAILAARGFSLVQIGFAETIFHIVSLIFEIPSGALADVFGRKKLLLAGCIAQMIGNVFMILSGSFFLVSLSIAFQALSYNFASGSVDALAYDSMKSAGIEDGFEKYESNQMIIYRICGGISTLCAGFALSLGHRLAYGADLIMLICQLLILATLHEIRIPGNETEKQESDSGQTATNQLKFPQPDSVHGKKETALHSLTVCMLESLRFIARERKALLFMSANSLVGAGDILLLFFLQARLPQAGIPAWGLGIALLFMELGGVAGSWLIVKAHTYRFRTIFLAALLLVVSGYLAEHTGIWWLMTLGGFVSALADDALQVRSNAILQSMFPSEQRATLISMESFTFSVIMIILSPLAGILFSCW